jgi:hypothetical protein
MGARPFFLANAEPSEHELQEDCTAMLERILLPGVCWTAIDHGHSLDRTIGRHGVPIGLIEARKRKKRGVKPGLPDYLFWHGRAFAIELKTVDGTLSEDQEDFLQRLIVAGTEVKVCWSKSQVFDTVVCWGLTRPMTVSA